MTRTRLAIVTVATWTLSGGAIAIKARRDGEWPRINVIDRVAAASVAPPTPAARGGEVAGATPRAHLGLTGLDV